jgi:general secretion pathway protein G
VVNARTRGFTLIELLAVMAIIAVLLTLAVPRYFNSLDRSKEAALKENLKVLRVTLDKYHADRGRFPDTLEDLVAHKYLRAVPVDPITEAPSWVAVPSEESGSPGIADVRSSAQGRTAEGVPYGEL